MTDDLEIKKLDLEKNLVVAQLEAVRYLKSVLSDNLVASVKIEAAKGLLLARVKVDAPVKDE